MPCNIIPGQAAGWFEADAKTPALLCFKALIMANDEPRYAELARCARGVVFFGTPHQGIRHGFKRWSLLAGALASVGMRVNTKLLRTLRPGSKDLTYLSEHFRFFAPKYGIATFYERNGSKNVCESRGCVCLMLKDRLADDYTLLQFIERQSAAVLGVEHEGPVGLNGSHSALCKFDRIEDLSFGAVWSAIRSISHGQGAASSGS
jgi:hypothetical protein